MEFFFNIIICFEAKYLFFFNVLFILKVSDFIRIKSNYFDLVLDKIVLHIKNN